MLQKPFAYKPDQGATSQFSILITRINIKRVAETIIVLRMNGRGDCANFHKAFDAHDRWCAYQDRGNTNQIVATCDDEKPLSLPIGHILRRRNHLAEAWQVGGALSPVLMHFQYKACFVDYNTHKLGLY